MHITRIFATPTHYYKAVKRTCQSQLPLQCATRYARIRGAALRPLLPNVRRDLREKKPVRSVLATSLANLWRTNVIPPDPTLAAT